MRIYYSTRTDYPGTCYTHKDCISICPEPECSAPLNFAMVSIEKLSKKVNPWERVSLLNLTSFGVGSYFFNE
jgi:hypothetical protein